MKNKRGFFGFIHRYRNHLVLALIVCAGLWFRFFRIAGSVWALLGYDESRDMLVARHVVEYGGWVWRGPLSSGSMNQLMNSPAYYYLMSTLWFIGRSPVAVMILWSAALACLMYMAYRIGTLIWDKRLGIIMVLLFAIQPTLISNSRHISQPYLLPLFSMMFLWAFWDKSSMTLGKLCMFIAILMVPMHIHYGSLLILPAGFLWLGTEWIGHIKHKKPGLHWWYVPMLVAEYFLLLWVWLTYSSTPYDQQFFLLGEVQSNWTRFIPHLYMAGTAMLDNFWWSKEPAVVVGMLVLFIGVTVWYFKNRTHDMVRMRKYWWMVLFAVTPPIIASFHGDIIHPSYLLSALPFLLILAALGLRAILAMNRYVGWVCVFIIIWIFAEQALTVIQEVPPRSYYEQLRNVSQAIYEDYRVKDPVVESEPKIALAALAGRYLPYDGWGTGALWYFLEDQFGNQLVDLSDYGVNFVPVVTKPDYFYVLCDYRGFTRGPYDSCIRDFTKARSYLLDGNEQVYTSDIFDVWRFRIDTTKQVPNYNVAYPGL